MGDETKMLDRLKKRARGLKQNIYVLYLAYRDPRIPWYAKLFVICVVAYAFSPIDLIPDFIPILGYLDDLIIVPLGVALALRMIPKSIIDEYRVKAEETRHNGKKKNWIVGTLFIMIWVVAAVWISMMIYNRMT